MKMERGITLVALIVTIVILIILAVVAITSIEGSDIIQYANNSATKYGASKNNESVTINGYEGHLNTDSSNGDGNTDVECPGHTGIKVEYTNMGNPYCSGSHLKSVYCAECSKLIYSVEEDHNFPRESYYYSNIDSWTRRHHKSAGCDKNCGYYLNEDEYCTVENGMCIYCKEPYNDYIS